MKFLVLALCVCVASAAFPRPYQPPEVAHTSAKVLAAPVVSAAKTVAAVSSDSEREATILRSDSSVNPDGYVYSFETENGISAAASGSLKPVDKIDTLVVQGSYKYIAPDGTPVQVEYVADENGYHPSSDLLPVAPPIPEAILRSVAYIAAHPPQE